MSSEQSSEVRYNKLMRIKHSLIPTAVAILGILIFDVVLSNKGTQSQKEIGAILQKTLDQNLNKKVEVVECYGDSYGPKLEYYRYGCNYISKESKNLGLSYVDEGDITPPFWIMSPAHRLSMLLFQKAAEDGKKITVQYAALDEPDSTKLSVADKIQQENLVKAITSAK